MEHLNKLAGFVYLCFALQAVIETEAACGNRIQASIEPTIFTTPHYPSSYPSNKNCRWVISSSHPGSTVRVTFTNFRTESGYDYISVNKGGSSRRYQGSPRVPFTISSDEQITIRFHSDSSVQYPGFRAEVIEIAPTTIPTTIETEGCPAGQRWRVFEGRCYLMKTSTKTWISAEADCQSMGGHLASILNESVSSFLEDNLYVPASSLWIGLSCRGERNWEAPGVKWVTGEPLVYANWHQGEPSSPRYGREECASLRSDMHWNDRPCSTKMKYLCSTLLERNDSDCSHDNSTCHANATCASSTSSSFCICKEGFEGNGRNCSDVNECVNGTEICGPNSVCENTIGNYSCSCANGFNNNGSLCVDINECMISFNNCHSNGICTNTNGNYTCTCSEGFSGNGFICSDINECSFGIDRCPMNTTCTNTLGGYSCVYDEEYSGESECDAATANCSMYAICTNQTNDPPCTCLPGFEGNGEVCTDVDECNVSNNSCGSNSHCFNIVGSFICVCDNGFTGNETHCFDINECLNDQNICSIHANCTNTAGNYSCICNDGYTGNGFSCSDIDECDAGVCYSNSSCSNYEGGFNCSCSTGFTGDGFNCSDVDECSYLNSSCPLNSLCVNTYGNYTCYCNQGYTGSGRTCIDIDECLIGNDDCDLHSTCVNSNGSYSCECMDGFSGNGTFCTDINECNMNNTCDVNANCTNRMGGYSCTCLDGFTGDGLSCSDVNECSNFNACDENGNCTNVVGSFMCSCNLGYSGDGQSCADINECNETLDNCDIKAMCVNIPGSFLCNCIDGFTGNGTYCVDVDECTSGSNVCLLGESCLNTEGSYVCSTAVTETPTDVPAEVPSNFNQVATVNCDDTSMYVEVPSQYFQDKNITLESLHLLDYNCGGYPDPDNDEVWIFNIPDPYLCSTSVTVNSTHLQYKNAILNSKKNTNTPSRTNLFGFSCSYNSNSDKHMRLYNMVKKLLYKDSVSFGVPSVLTSINRYVNGHFDVPMTEEKTNGKIQVLIEVYNTSSTSYPVIDECWVTPTSDIFDLKKHYLFKEGCPASSNEESQITLTSSENSLYFESKVFQFKDVKLNYLHCSLHMCESENDNDCKADCPPLANKKTTFSNLEGNSENNKDILSIGPFFLNGAQTVASSSMTIFLITIASIASLW